MRFMKTRLLAVLVMACFSGVFFVSPVSAATISTSTHQTTAHTLSQQVNPLASGGGCSAANPAVAACISINSSKLVIPDAYVNLSLGCPYEADILTWWRTSDGAYHDIYAVAGTGSCVYGHFYGHQVPLFANTLYYYTEAIAFYSKGTLDDNTSPNVYP